MLTKVRYKASCRSVPALVSATIHNCVALVKSYLNKRPHGDEERGTTDNLSWWLSLR
jgi:hypothetical protein